MCTWLRVLAVSLLALAVTPVAQAQEPEAGTPPPHLAYVEGAVEMQLDGHLEPALPSTALLDGDRVHTRNGRAEIVHADGTVVHLDRDTTIEVMSPTRLRVTGGRLVVRTSAAVPEVYVVDTAAASIELGPRGEYTVRMDEGRGGLSLAVARGLADAETWSGRVVVRAGELADVPESGPVRLSTHNSARWDGFDRWSADRVNGFSTAASAAQLPYELRSHGPILDRYGSWGYVASYGSVWFPRAGPTWRPYQDGRWRQTRYGWTWVGYDPWAWPTHHYGRWGFSGNVWFWIPARVWGPAWVSWAHAPSYVSWAPLGWDGRPVLAFSARIGSHDPWRAWTVLPSHRLGHRGNLRAWSVDGRRLPADVRSGFQVRPAAAAPRGPAWGSAPTRRGSVGPPVRGRGTQSPRVAPDAGPPVRSPQRAFEDVRSGARATMPGRAPRAQVPAPEVQRRSPRVQTDAGGFEREASRPAWGGRSRPPQRESAAPARATEPTRSPADGARGRSGWSARPQESPRTAPAGEPRRESAGPPPARAGADRRAMPRGATGGQDGSAGDRSVSPSPTPRGEPAARPRPGGVRRPPPQ